MRAILGISCFYHDSAAALVIDGTVVAAAQEERFSRKKHDSGFPRQAAAYCLAHAGITARDLEYVVFYEKPFLKWERLLVTYIRTWPRGLRSFLQAAFALMGEKLWVEKMIRDELGYTGEVLYTEHHYAHAASAYYSSPFNEAAIVTMDGVGEWDTTTIGHARGPKITLTHSISFPDSLGLLYSALTYYLGFKVNSAEYKVMGLAPYGDPTAYHEKIASLIDRKKDGSFRLVKKYFAYEYGLTMTSVKLDALLGGPPRKPDEPLMQRHKDIAAALQKVMQECVLGVVAQAKLLTNATDLCMAGGVALNCVANERILASGLFQRVYVHPASGDAGGAAGAALYVAYDMLGHKKEGSAMRSAYVGPKFTAAEILSYLAGVEDISYEQLEGEALYGSAARLLEEGNIIGWFQGRMEYGPRALGNRSILADPRKGEVRDRINREIKFREDFRPFAPAVLEEHASRYFDIRSPSPYMLFTAHARAGLPAVTHVDGSARVETVNAEENEEFYSLLQAFFTRTGCPVLLNTSYNVRGEPVVATPQDALECFLSTAMDYAVLGPFLVSKKGKRLPRRSFESD